MPYIAKTLVKIRVLLSWFGTKSMMRGCQTFLEALIFVATTSVILTPLFARVFAFLQVVEASYILLKHGKVSEHNLTSENGMFSWLAFKVPSLYFCFYDHLKQNHKSGSEGLKRPAFLLAF